MGTLRKEKLHLPSRVPAKLRLSTGNFPRKLRSPRHRYTGHNPAKTLLWIDDYEPALLVYQAIFESHGFRVLTAARPSVGLQLALDEKIDVVITDYEMPEMSGASVAVAVKKSKPAVPVIFFSGSGTLPERITNLADAYCDKAAPIERLIATVNHLLQQKSTSPSVLHPVLPLPHNQPVVA